MPHPQKVAKPRKVTKPRKAQLIAQIAALEIEKAALKAQLRKSEQERENMQQQLTRAAAMLTWSQPTPQSTSLDHTLLPTAVMTDVLGEVKESDTVLHQYWSDQTSPAAPEWTNSSPESGKSATLDRPVEAGIPFSQINRPCASVGDRHDQVSECCGQAPVDIANQGCSLCGEHCELFTPDSMAEMGTDWPEVISTCPICNEDGYNLACTWDWNSHFVSSTDTDTRPVSPSSTSHSQSH
ncbi:uncharacterized protein PV07_12701 [Cladophialophora immunda]|uniref:Uncharacterized protein n=1 Tax=Cladophialophora immunda TaxID=569365 RepID=A0A0D2BS55_9EURO|nr:uncharacterized protein PV07_12701 [Cladophialophora immunda]KIW21888.1 hypothetical protein PV07_12701 [Cladophialophora immunda]